MTSTGTEPGACGSVTARVPEPPRFNERSTR